MRRSRRAAAVALLLLAAASDRGSDDPRVAAGTEASGAEEDERIDCRPAGADAFARTCTIEQASVEGGDLLTVRDPEGGFHRLLIGPDGTIAAAEGAEPLTMAPAGEGVVEIGIGEARYRLPIGGKPASPPPR